MMSKNYIHTLVNIKVDHGIGKYSLILVHSSLQGDQMVTNSGYIVIE